MSPNGTRSRRLGPRRERPAGNDKEGKVVLAEMVIMSI
jgi:hypothetical protein